MSPLRPEHELEPETRTAGDAEIATEHRAGDRRVRLQAAREPSIAPWVKSKGQTGCHLYWIPFSMPENVPRQREWVLAFSHRLETALLAEAEAEPYFFLALKVINEHLSQPFYTRIQELSPIMGLSRRPGAPLPELPDQRHIEGLQTGRIKYDHKALQPDYCYHFLRQDMPLAMGQFFGVGGSMTLYLPIDKRQKPPVPSVPLAVQNDPGFAPLLQFARLDQTHRELHRMQSPVFPRSRLIFGRGLEDNLRARGVRFIMPLLSVAAFEQASAADLEEWFSFFTAILTESPEDRGLLLASKDDLDPTLDRIAAELRDDLHLEYPVYA